MTTMRTDLDHMSIRGLLVALSETEDALRICPKRVAGGGPNPARRALLREQSAICASLHRHHAALRFP